MTTDPHEHDLPDDGAQDRFHASEGDAFRAHFAQNWWPPPLARDAPGLPPEDASQPPVHRATYDRYAAERRSHRSSRQPLSPGRPTRGWRSVGVAALGLVGGFLTAIVLQDVIGVAFIRDTGGTVPMAVALLIGALLPLLSAVGVIIALLVDRAARRRERRPDDRR